jgi:glutamine---fructose-6-phosphate transaminase (isomerizing)
VSGIIASPSEENRVPDLKIIEGDYVRDILDQPAALRNTVNGLNPPRDLSRLAAELNRGRFHRIVLTGMGSSFYALHPLNLALITAGFTAIQVETSELVHYSHHFFDAKTLLVAVSQSGKSAEMVRLLEMNRRHSPVVAVTNSPRSPLASGANATLLTRAGKEFSVSCKTYLTALMALKWLGDVLCEKNLERTRRQLAEAPLLVECYLTDWKGHVRAFAGSLKKIRHLFLVGRGDSLAAVGTGALIIKESAHFHAEGMSSAAFRHGPFEMLGRETFVLVFSGQPRTKELNRRLWHDIREKDGHAEIVGEAGAGSPYGLPRVPIALLPIIEILPVQMITLALAACRGREAGRFELASKVTTVE